MLPILLNGSNLRAGVVGEGDALERRVHTLVAAGVTPRIFAERLPGPEDLAQLQILFVAGLEEAQAGSLAEAARRVGVLVNVEDKPGLSDFHVPAQVRRGDLILTVSTGGRSPGLSRLLREDLERRFGPEWDDRLDEIARLREHWRAQGASPNDVSQRTRAVLSERGWLS